ncbi:hypothetical protein [Photorhabdus sp. RM323S]|uniref:hypothetical protein n=1 Tax=Photorhabdus sp. RM323S TaxID=3342828 RepID=UPI0036D86067
MLSNRPVNTLEQAVDTRGLVPGALGDSAGSVPGSSLADQPADVARPDIAVFVDGVRFARQQ